MTEQEAKDMAKQLLTQHGDRGFDVSMGDRVDYDLMRTAFDRLGRETGANDASFVVRVLAWNEDALMSLPRGGI